MALDPDLDAFAGRQAVLDVGGGSSEFIPGESDEIIFAGSLRIGAVRLTERCLKHDPPLPEELAGAAALVDSMLADIGARVAADRLVGVGGSAVNLARIGRRIPAERSA